MKKGFICGVFDLFHYGHLLAFRECKKHCDHLTVAVNSAENFDEAINPGKKKPLFPLAHRVEILRSCMLIDQVLTYDSEAELMKVMEEGQYDVRFLGDDYRGKQITGEGLSGEIVFIDRSHGWSTSYFRKLLSSL